MKRIKLEELTKSKLRRLSRAAKGNIYFGADPEFFVSNNRGMILNSDMFFPHKDKPLRIPINRFAQISYGKLYFDGIQAEFAFPPAICRVYVIERVYKMLARAQKIIGDDHRIVLKPSVKVRKEVLDRAHPDARIFGCMPDFNAYTLTTNTPEMDASKHPYRYSGGHIHLGMYDNPYFGDKKNEDKGVVYYEFERQRELVENPEEHIRWVKALDFFVNLITLPLDNSPAAKRRRSKYGKAGCFRPTPYGIEYRSLSCWWLKSPVFVSLIFGLARLATIYVYHKDGFEKIMRTLKIDEEDIRGAINESDAVFAKRVWRNVRALLSKLNARRGNFLYSNYTYAKDKKALYSGKTLVVQPLTLLDYLINEGAEGIVDLKNVKSEWQLLGPNRTYVWADRHGFYRGLKSKLLDFLGEKKVMKYEFALAKRL